MNVHAAVSLKTLWIFTDAFYNNEYKKVEECCLRLTIH